MPTTSNFGWTTPADTDLVKDGALAIRTLGNGIDTTLVDLKGGTTGQILSKASNTDLDYTWINNDQGDITEVQAGTGISVASGTGPIPVVTNTVATAFDAKGDLVAGTGADTFAKLTVGANNTVLTADSTTATGLKWAAPAGGLTFISRTSFSNVASQAFDNVFSSSYFNYLVVIDKVFAATVQDDLQIQFRYAGPTTETAGYYGTSIVSSYNSTTVTNENTNNTTQMTILTDIGSTTYPNRGYFYVEGVGNATEIAHWHGMAMSAEVGKSYVFNGYANTQRTYTGFLLKTNSSNISGTVSIYGLAKA